MSKIKVLDKKVYSQISAGEVVEKPASIVKELVENCLDAGAKNITIEIKNGGTTYICITDDGCGISEQDVCVAFLPHATSKLSSIEDLQTLCSMGFRGEALSSISAVTNIEMITKTENDLLGTKIELSGGEVINTSKIASVTGTKIIVKDLFFNTPARAKFLRKIKTEENDITTYVEKLMLSSSDVNFKYIVDSKIMYNTTNCSTMDIIYTIYGSEVATNLIEVNYERNGFMINGYIGKPNIAKANRTYQTLFVNKRYCINSTISAAISNTYDNYLMKGRFPLYVLFLTLPPDSVDVNVHPNKLEVKFEDSKKIFGLFSSAVNEALANLTHINIIDEPQTNAYIKIENPILQNLDKDFGVSFNSVNDKKENPTFNMRTNINKKIEDVLNSNVTPNEWGQSSQMIFNKPTILDEIILESKNENKDKNNENYKEQNTISLSNIRVQEQQAYEQAFKQDKLIIGTAFDTYVIVQSGENLYLIDQHAAHERILFDKLMNELDKNEITSQQLLMPYVLNVSTQECSFIENNISNFNYFGFNIEAFGKNCFKVSSIPLILAEINLKDYFSNLLSNLSQLVKKPTDIIRDTFATMACKSAVKGGTKLSNAEIEYLLDLLKDNKTTLLCPHGRPFFVSFDKKELEKMFKRIV